MTLDELQQSRIAAGARYAAAVDELKVALVDLAALDRAFGSAPANGGGAQHVPTFASIPSNVGGLAHPVFAPGPIGGRWTDEVNALTETYVNRLSER